MLSFLLGFLPSAVQLSSKIADLILARQAAKTDLEKAKIDEQIKELSYQRDVIVESQKNPWTAKVYWTLLAIAAIGPITYINKIFLWDKVIGAFNGCVGRVANCDLFTTDPLVDPNLWKIVIAVFTFLFLTSVFSKK